MKRALARRWSKALESGLYPQTKGKLRDLNGLCCLAVLCSLHAEDHPEVAARNTDINFYEGMSATLPGLVRNWSNISSSNGEFYQGDVFTSLSDMNDSGSSFQEIAKVIRKHYKEL